MTSRLAGEPRIVPSKRGDTLAESERGDALAASKRADALTELVMVVQRPGDADAAPWILDRHGERVEGHDDSRRTRELQRGLERHARVSATTADADMQEVERLVGRLHEPDYVRLLKEIDWEQPRLLPELAPPGLPADSPVWAGVARAAFEGARTAVAAAQQVLGGARFAYAVCRPPGHHAGPAWMGGYCYLNTAGVAAQALLDGGVRPVAILDVDFHFPTGTRAIAERMRDVRLHSLHASTLQEVPWRELVAREHERFMQFEGDPDPSAYLEALRASLDEIARQCAAIVLSLGYDIVDGDPHGSWSFTPSVFTEIGRLLADCGLPVCVVQEGGYAVKELADCAHAFAEGLVGNSAAGRGEP